MTATLAIEIDGIEKRLSAWRADGNPDSLWPHIRTADRLRAHDEITRVTRCVLNDRDVTLESNANVLDALGVAAFVSGMGPLLGSWLETGRIQADHRIRALFDLHLQHNRERAARLHNKLVQIVALCDERAIDVIVLKGAHVAHVYFPEPGARPATDIDLLVRPESTNALRRVLSDLGYIETRATEYPQRSEWSADGGPAIPKSLEMEHADSPWSIDLHTHLDRSYFRGLSASFGERVFTTTTCISLAGCRARVLAQPLLSAHLALNASHSIEELRLLRIAELVMVLRADRASGALVWSDVHGLVRETGTARFVYPAFALAEQLSPGTVPEDFQQFLRASTTARLRRAVARVSHGNVELGGRSLTEKMMWSRGPIEFGRNLIDVLLPPDSNLSMREMRESYVRRARRALRRQTARTNSMPRPAL